MIHSGEQKESDIRLLTTKNLTTKEKLAFYEDADYCFVTKEEMLPILKMELDSIIRDGGVYYNVYNKIDDPETKIVVLFFDDFTIDLQAEIHDVKTRLSNYPVLTEFRCYASDMFEQFNARQVHSIINQTLEDHMDRHGSPGRGRRHEAHCARAVASGRPLLVLWRPCFASFF